ncbi:MAG TPA: hypothetical protein VF172_08515 [Nitrososphaera sp.]
MVHKNFRRQRRLESRLDQTVRIASIVQKGIATGRSSYVEMRSLDRLISHNIKAKVSEIKKSVRLSTELDELLTKTLLHAVSDGYAKVLTPNGIVREKELEHLLSIDSDIVVCLGMIVDAEKTQKMRGLIDVLRELIEERKKLVEGTLKA